MAKNIEIGKPENDTTKIITKEDFLESDFEAPLKKLNTVDYWELETLFQTEIKERQVEGKNRNVNALILLADICKIDFSPEKGLNPQAFPPHFRWADGRRTTVPCDYAGEQSKVFAELVPEIKNPALQARLADIAWQNDRSLTDMAKYAVRAYTRSISEVLNGSYNFCKSDSNPGSNLGCDYLLRAMLISNSPGSRVPVQEKKNLKNLISEVARHSHENRVYPGFTRLPKMCLDYSIGSPIDIAKTTEKMAKDQDMSVCVRQGLWKLAAKAYQKGQSEEDKKRCLIASAECYVEKSLTFGKGRIETSHYLNKAIQELQLVPGMRERRKEIEEQLRGAQKNIPDQLSMFSREVDMTPYINFVRTSIGGIDLPQSLRNFAFIHQPSDPEVLRKNVDQRYEHNPLLANMPITVVDWNGKNKTGMLEPGREEWFRHQILQTECFCWQTVAVMVDQAISIIQSEHRIQSGHYHILADHSCFIPAGKHGLVASGLENFLCRNYIASLHILVPQFESSLRYLLEQVGTDTSTMQADLTQELLTLSQILNKDNLYRQKLESIFGEALVFEMDLLFNYKGGPSLRHSLSHGLLSENECLGSYAIYACWFIYRFYFLSLNVNWERVKDDLERFL